MIVIAEVLNNAIRVVSRHPTFAEAEAKAKAAFYPVIFERDPDHENAADFISCHGRQYVIEPAR